MQNVQVLSQPTEIDTQAENGDSRRLGRSDGKFCSASTISTWASRVVPGPFEQDGQAGQVVGAEHDVDPGRPVDDRAAVLLRQAAADRDLHARVGPAWPGSRWPRLP